MGEWLNPMLEGLASTVGVVGGSIPLLQWVAGYWRKQTQGLPSSQVLELLHRLGCTNEATIKQAIEKWKPATQASSELRQDLVRLLTNLVRGARFHSTQGTPVSSYLRCERLIEQLLSNLEPKRKAEQEVALGWTEWKLKQFLGMGSFGEVWIGKNKGYPVPRAFKFFTATEGLNWLKQEGQALYYIRERLDDHPNVVEYHDIALEAKPFPYLMLEYVPGGSLEDWLYALPGERVALDIAEVMGGIARGIASAHKAQITHRDLKPANILLTTGVDPIPKIGDFGLGQVEKVSGESAAGVSQMVLVGTRMYHPPEAADPYKPRSAKQDDVFAFGVIWYQLVVGVMERPPYDFAARLEKAGADTRTTQLISRCLAHPEARFKDGEELKEAIERDSAPYPWAVPADGFDVGLLAREYLAGEMS